MRTSPRRSTCALAAGLTAALAPSAFGQIIATSVPSEPERADGRKWAIHVMAAPLAKWRYNEVFIDVAPSSYSVVGEIVGRPSSTIMLAGEVSIGRGDGFVFSAGGWYNELGSHTFDVTGALTLAPSPEFPQGYVDIHNAAFRTDLSMAEYHAAVSYKGFGVQVGLVSTSGAFTSGEFLDDNRRPNDPPTPYATSDLPKAETTDYDLFAVYRRVLGRQDHASIALGVGAYRKQAIVGTNASPLRTGQPKTVLSAFAAASVNLYKGIGLDASYWYVGPSDAPDQVGDVAGFTLASDQQSRLTVGVGYTF